MNSCLGEIDVQAVSPSQLTVLSNGSRCKIATGYVATLLYSVTVLL